MNDSIPDGISLESLKELMDTATPEVETEPKGNGPFDGLTKGQLLDLADNLCDAALDKCKDPMIHKAIVFTIMSKMIAWHEAMADEMIEDQGRECAYAWQRDAGKLQAICNILSSVTFGDDDFMTV